jgi:triosephosphate isomerase
MKSITIINFKTYKQGKDVLKLAQTAEKVSKKIIVGVQTPYIREVSSKTKLEVYAEHVDYFEIGRNTGFILPEDVKASGAVGTFLNHSEHKLKFGVIEKTVERCRAVGLKVAIFASSLKEAKKIEKLNPDFLIYEPPELVAGDVSVSSAKPEIIKKISEKIKMPFLVGAGIKTRGDVETSLKLGAVGIAVASGITKSDNPKKAIEELAI